MKKGKQGRSGDGIRTVTVIGGGLAGSEAAWQIARHGIPVRLFEMKPVRFSPAHKKPHLAELVCSNSLRSADIFSAVGLLKEEMRIAGSLIINEALESQIPAGKALAVDREKFSQGITQKIHSHPLIEVIRSEVTEIPEDGIKVLASGPLTSQPLSDALRAVIGVDYLHFFDAIAPIILAESIDYSIVFRQSRYGPEGEGDYLNCPMDRSQYEAFVSQLLRAEMVPLHSFEKVAYFEGCLPIEIMAQRGLNTLRFGPMKPVGLTDPKTGAEPYAVVQLRQEDREGSMYNMVGFQTKLKWNEQERIFRMIPGLEQAEFVRLGSVHRNTFVCAPEVLRPTLQIKNRPDIFLAGQISGVEGYVESTAMGWLAGTNAAKLISGQQLMVPPWFTAHGALVHHITTARPKGFQPMNVNFGLFPRLELKLPKKERGRAYSKRALSAWEAFMRQAFPTK